ncbi:hypothetical protein ACWGJW_31005 [Streptomyces nigrescens]
MPVGVRRCIVVGVPAVHDAGHKNASRDLRRRVIGSLPRGSAFLGLWIVFYLLDANQGNVFVQFVKGLADTLAWWAQDIFTMDAEGLRVALHYGLPAAIYLLAGHLIAGRVRRL